MAFCTYHDYKNQESLTPVCFLRASVQVCHLSAKVIEASMTNWNRTAVVNSTTPSRFSLDYRKIIAVCLNYNLVGLQVANYRRGRASRNADRC
jgi:hypothetical protein